MIAAEEKTGGLAAVRPGQSGLEASGAASAAVRLRACPFRSCFLPARSVPLFKYIDYKGRFYINNIIGIIGASGLNGGIPLRPRPER